MKTRIKPHRFVFTQRTHDLLGELKTMTELSYTEIVRIALDNYAVAIKNKSRISPTQERKDIKSMDCMVMDVKEV